MCTAMVGEGRQVGAYVYHSGRQRSAVVDEGRGR